MTAARGDRSDVAIVVLLREDGAALLQHRDDKPGINHPGIWAFPGGHRDAAETDEACARREFFEETAYRLDRIARLTRFLDDNEGLPAPVWVTVFWCRWDRRQRPVCLEGQALEFVPRARARAISMPDYLVKIWDEAAEAAGASGRSERNR